ncbi:MAG: recombinase family protein [Anaerolineaceae bacterium]|nr:recombinase family protein [Anaerolineaceae bacterium]
MSVFEPGSQVVLYARDSGGDDQDLSIEQQLLELKKWCTDNELLVSKVFSDTSSGTTTEGRSNFRDMIDYFQKSKVPESGIVVWKFNRFARNLNDSMYYKSGLRRKGYEVCAIKDALPEGSTGKLVEMLFDWMAQKFSEDLSEDVKRAIRQLVLTHGALGACPPIGFKREPVILPSRRDGKEHIVHRWVPDYSLWPVLIEAWNLKAEGVSVAEIHGKLRFYKNQNSYYNFFANMIYKGQLRFGDLVIQSYTEPMITEELWNQVNATFRGGTYRHAPRKRRWN